MPAWLWITALALAGLAVFVALGRRWWHALWYSWTRAAHVIELTEREPVPAPEYGSMSLDAERGWDGGFLPAPPVDPAPWRAQMTAELSPEALEAARENTRQLNERVQRAVDAGGGIVDLPPGLYAPLEPLPEVVLPAPGGWISGPCLDDPGPGDAAVIPPASSGPDHDAPGWPWAAAPVAGAGEVGITAGPQGIPAAPAQPPPSRWLAEQLDILRAWSERQQVYAEVLA